MKRRRIARFVPKRTDNLQPGIEKHIGKVFLFDLGFTKDEDDGDYAGQTTWMFSRAHDEELGPENAGRWVPDEDLEDIV